MKENQHSAELLNYIPDAKDLPSITGEAQALVNDIVINVPEDHWSLLKVAGM